jgi:diaminopimelate epimerase
MRFAKWQGTGNDYILIEEDHLLDHAPLTPEDARLLCDRHFGIGGDGILLLGRSEHADARMRIFNPDGSMAEMCGNGIRMAARYLVEHELVQGNEFAIETAGGLIRPHVLADGKVRVDMGLARTEEPETVDTQSHGNFHGRAVSMGNPHFVVARPPADLDLEQIGPAVERHPRFPDRTNVEFIEVVDPGCVRMRVWERGVGETLACGTGACAVAVCALLDHGCERAVIVELPGGSLTIEVDPDTLQVHMTGPAAETFAGTLDLGLVRAAAPASRFPADAPAPV